MRDFKVLSACCDIRKAVSILVFRICMELNTKEGLILYVLILKMYINMTKEIINNIFIIFVHLCPFAFICPIVLHCRYQHPQLHPLQHLTKKKCLKMIPQASEAVKQRVYHLSPVYPSM
mmetsp:Transcript_20172/g.28919  ORF Transcript_20172/g.28919 Transcript_20172/m.28919 type:complete len:119 (+) Transcript_20172:1964-2320(+)